MGNEKTYLEDSIKSLNDFDLRSGLGILYLTSSPIRFILQIISYKRQT